MKAHALMATALCAAIPTLANAHASLETGKAGANAMYKAVLRVPHGCDGAATRTVRVSIPEGVIAVKPMPKAGWQLTTVKGDYAKNYDHYGTPTSSGVKEVVWSGGNLPDEFYDEFVFRARITDFPAGHVLAFPAVQECDTGKVAWIEVPAAGQDPHSLAHPAPTVTIAAAAGSGHHHDTAHAGHVQGPIGVGHAWARASAGPVKTGAAYLTVTNTGTHPDRLLAVSSSAAKRVEMHTNLTEAGVMKMRPLEALDVPAGESVTLAPGGHHIMLMGLNKPLVEGESFPLTLTFERAGAVDVEVSIGAAGAMDAGKEHKHN